MANLTQSHIDHLAAWLRERNLQLRGLIRDELLGRSDASREHGGLGLGVFIARTLLERTGAKVAFTNRIFPDHGAVVQIGWPRRRFEAGEISAEATEISAEPAS